MQNRRQPGRHKLVSILIPLGLIVIALIIAAFLMHKLTASSEQPTQLARDSNGNSGLMRELTDLQSRLDGKGLTAAEMQNFAAEIQKEIQTHPLPDDDDLQFSGDLVVKYLRELAAIENYRRAALSS